jgi:hypothetical protein
MGFGNFFHQKSGKYCQYFFGAALGLQEKAETCTTKFTRAALPEIHRYRPAPLPCAAEKFHWSDPGPQTR